MNEKDKELGAQHSSLSIGTPAIRFKGFSDEWEERKLLDNMEKIIDFRGRTPKKIGFDWSETGYLALSALNVKNGYIDLNVEAHYGNQDLYDKWMSGNELHKNQVLFTTEAPMGNVAQIPDNKRYILSQRTIAFEVNYKLITEDFLAVMLSSSSIFQKLSSLSSGGTAKGVSQKSLSTVDVFISKEITEQTKIGSYFQQLDTLITQHQRKHDKLLNVKKAMLEKMFPKKGAEVPEIRFKGFSEKWEERKLGEVAKITMGQSPNGVNYTDNPEDYILVQGNADMKNGMVVPRIWTKQVTKTADAEDLIFSVRAPVGEIGKTTYNIVIGRGVAAIKGNEFIFQSLKRMNENGYWKKLSAGSTFDSINSTDLSTAVIATANPVEQTKIGNLFKHLDTLLSLHQSELEKLKNIKKACLEKMFV